MLCHTVMVVMSWLSGLVFDGFGNSNLMDQIHHFTRIRDMRDYINWELLSVLVHFLQDFILMHSYRLPDVTDVLGLLVHELQWKQEPFSCQNVYDFTRLYLHYGAVVLGLADGHALLGQVAPPQRGQIACVRVQVLLNPATRFYVYVLFVEHFAAFVFLTSQAVLEPLEKF